MKHFIYYAIFMSMRKLTCPQCKTPFETDNPQKVYCNQKCKNRAMNRLFNRGCQQMNRGLIKKARIVKESGGKCSVCGYDKNLSSLTFHHLEPDKKSFPLDTRAFANRKHSLLMEEVKKCIVVCRNCHGEVENPQYNDWQEKW